MFHQVIPALPARRIAETHAFYEAHLGFRRVHEEDSYGIIARDEVELHFFQSDDVAYAHNTMYRVRVTGIDALYAALAAKAMIHPNAPLTTKPWGTREFAVIDPNGVCITFFERP